MRRERNSGLGPVREPEMESLGLRIYGSNVLRKKGANVEEFDDELALLIDRMVETMIIEDGVGLAAPQVGVSKQVAVAALGNWKNSQALKVRLFLHYPAALLFIPDVAKCDQMEGHLYQRRQGFSRRFQQPGKTFVSYLPQRSSAAVFTGGKVP